MVKVLVGIVVGVALAVPESREQVVALGHQLWVVLVSTFHALTGVVTA